ncbi:MAG: nucleotide exchange factor GrpE [Candidatus Nanopelagicales bacterium]|nr:nucleotide exchange factor GrpE [Candidatus Nanopelagicales bacterium]
MTQPDEEGEGIRIRDSRRIDPLTYEVRESARQAADLAAEAAQSQVPAEPEGDESAVKIAELTDHLQRLSADYANYRKRVDRDRALQAEVAIASVMVDLLPVLDDVDRARDHGELDGGFKAVADAIGGLVERNGVSGFGDEGESFDPTVHEAMTSETREDVESPTVVKVYQRGYKMGERVLRPARVGVADKE